MVNRLPSTALEPRSVALKKNLMANIHPFVQSQGWREQDDDGIRSGIGVVDGAERQRGTCWRRRRTTSKTGSHRPLSHNLAKRSPSSVEPWPIGRPHSAAS